MGNKKFWGRKGNRFCQYCATDYNRFTVIVWTEATGGVFMVAVILHGEMLRAEWQSVIDVISKYFDPDADMPKDFLGGSNGEGSVFPFGPTCDFHGKTINCFCCYTSGGVITSKVLAKMLQRLGGLQVYNRMGGCYPLILLNADNYHLKLPFLQYTNY